MKPPLEMRAAARARVPIGVTYPLRRAADAHRRRDALGAILMLAAAGVAGVLGVPAKRRSLEELDTLPDLRPSL